MRGRLWAEVKDGKMVGEAKASILGGFRGGRLRQDWNRGAVTGWPKKKYIKQQAVTERDS